MIIISQGCKNIKWFYHIGDNIKTDRQDFILTNTEIRDKTKKSKTSNSGYCHEYQKWYEYTCKKCGTENLWIQENALKNNCGCPICNKIRQRTNSKWLYEIGQILKDNKRDMTIIDKEVRKREQKSKTCKSGITYHNEKYYKYKCNICKWDGGWMIESALKSGQGCSCCNSVTVVQGINDIPTTDPWMISYFQGGIDEAKKYTSGSSKKIYPICPDCGTVKNKLMNIYTIKNLKGISCICSDKISYPEKFFINFLKQANIPFETQFMFEGFKYRYDFILYSKKIDKLIIVETDGGLGHGRESYKKDINETRESVLRDMDKEILSLMYGIRIFRIDCEKSDMSYIKNSIVNNELLNYIDINLNNIDWKQCDEYATKNIIKEVCIDYTKGMSIEDLSKKYSLHTETVRRYLRKGKTFNWCQYIKKKRTIYKKEK